MVAAVRNHDGFVTPMAVVAGAVAEEILAAMTSGRSLRRTYVNNGGDIAFMLEPGACFQIGVVNNESLPSLIMRRRSFVTRLRFAASPPPDGADARTPSESPMRSRCWRGQRLKPMLRPR